MLRVAVIYTASHQAALYWKVFRVGNRGPCIISFRFRSPCILWIHAQHHTNARMSNAQVHGFAKQLETHFAYAQEIVHCPQASNKFQ